MTLADDITAALPALRAEAEGRMVDACIITESGAEPTFDGETGEYGDPEAPTVVYSGACEVQVSDGLNARQTEAGGTEVTLSRVTVKIPMSATGVQVGHVVKITASEHDPDLVDQKFTVLAGFAKTFATARRLQVERISA